MKKKYYLLSSFTTAGIATWISNHKSSQKIVFFRVHSVSVWWLHIPLFSTSRLLIIPVNPKKFILISSSQKMDRYLLQEMEIKESATLANVKQFWLKHTFCQNLKLSRVTTKKSLVYTFFKY